MDISPRHVRIACLRVQIDLIDWVIGLEMGVYGRPPFNLVRRRRFLLHEVIRLETMTTGKEFGV